MSKEKDWLVEIVRKHKFIIGDGDETETWEDTFENIYGTLQIVELAHSIRQELERRIEGKKKFYCEIHGIKQRRDKCIRCCETFMYREAIDEIIKEIS